MTTEEKIKQKRIQNLKHMDFVMRCINDEENGILESWLQVGVPDEASEEDYADIAEDEDSFNIICRIFAEDIAELLAEGHWGKDGYTRELFNSKAYIEAQDDLI